MAHFNPEDDTTERRNQDRREVVQREQDITEIHAHLDAMKLAMQVPDKTFIQKWGTYSGIFGILLVYGFGFILTVNSIQGTVKVLTENGKTYVTKEVVDIQFKNIHSKMSTESATNEKRFNLLMAKMDKIADKLDAYNNRTLDKYKSTN